VLFTSISGVKIKLLNKEYCSDSCDLFGLYCDEIQKVISVMTYFLKGRGFFLFRQSLLSRLRAIVEKSRVAVRKSHVAVKKSHVAVKKSHAAVRKSRVAVKKSRMAVGKSHAAVEKSRMAVGKSHAADGGETVEKIV